MEKFNKLKIALFLLSVFSLVKYTNATMDVKIDNTSNIDEKDNKINSKINNNSRKIRGTDLSKMSRKKIKNNNSSYKFFWITTTVGVFLGISCAVYYSNEKVLEDEKLKAKKITNREIFIKDKETGEIKKCTEEVYEYEKDNKDNSENNKKN